MGKLSPRTHPQEVRAKIAASLRGHAKSPEHRAKISAGLKGHKVSPETLAKMSAAQRGNQHQRNAPVLGECVYCGAPKAATRDHVIPRGRPGWDDPENLVVACLSCNSSKGNRTPEEWFTEDAMPTDEEVRADAAHLLKRYAKNLPRMTEEKRRRIVSLVAADLEAKARKSA